MRSKRRFPFPERAFTLIELVVVTAITGLVVAALGTFFATNYRAYLRQKVEIELEEDLRTALVSLVHELRVAAFSVDPKWDWTRYSWPAPGELQTDFGWPRISWRNSYSGQVFPSSPTETPPEEGVREFGFWERGNLAFPAGSIQDLEELRLRYFDTKRNLDCVYAYSAPLWSKDGTCSQIFAPAPGIIPPAPVRRIEIRFTAARSAPGGAVRRRRAAVVTLRNKE